MKAIKLIILALTFSVIACKSNRKAGVNGDSVETNDEESFRISDSRFLIVPGRSVGEISLGDDMQLEGKLLGKPDAGDAAMGKAWGIWQEKDSTAGKGELAIYSAYRDTSMRVKEVKQIRITNEQFKTQDGFSTGRTISDTKLMFPAMEQIASYINAEKDTVLIYDAKQDGIGFEFLKRKGIALTVHPMNQPINNIYLTLHPEWKLIQ